MAYLLKNNDNHIYIITYSQHSGLFYKVYSKTSLLKTSTLNSSSLNQYSATIDHKGLINVVCKDKKNQIIHFIESTAKFNQTVVLNDPENRFNISNLKLITANKQLHLFYTAQNPDDDSSNIIHHILDGSTNSTPQSITSTTALDTTYECFVYNNLIYMLSIDKTEEGYSLILSSYNCTKNEWILENSLVTTKNPITYCTMCIDKEGNNNILYIENNYAQLDLKYIKYNTKINNTSTLYTSAYEIEPILFIYNDSLWLNWKSGDKLLMMLSINSGESFTKPSYCSTINSNSSLIHYYSQYKNRENLQGNIFYGVESPFPNIFILNKLDMNNIHINKPSNNELKLYIDSLKDTTELNILKTENNELKEIQKDIIEQYEKLSSMVVKVQDEGKKWRSKYYDLKADS